MKCSERIATCSLGSDPVTRNIRWGVVTALANRENEKKSGGKA